MNPQKICPCDAARDVPADVPVVILSGARDRSATTAEAEAICAAVPAHAKLIRFRRGGHANLFKTDPQAYYDALRSLLRGEATTKP